MQSQRTPDVGSDPERVILLEGARDRRPGPEAHVDWSKGNPPGGPLPRDRNLANTGVKVNKQSAGTNPYRKCFLIKVVGEGDRLGELDEEPFTEAVLTWLAGELNRERTPLVINAPGVGNRGPKCAMLSVMELAGFVAKDGAKFDGEGPDGAGLYAEVEIMPGWIELISAMVDSPGGIDFTAHPPNAIKSLDVVVRPRGTGKVIMELKR